jgi:DNA-binding CsgD family transcriptional regulator
MKHDTPPSLFLKIAKIVKKCSIMVLPIYTDIKDKIELSVRELLRVVLSQRHWSRTGEDTSNVLLDIEVDGVRCLLHQVKPPLQSRCADLLTPREEEIAQRVAEGYPNKAIASELDISYWTVSSHLRRIFAKLGVSSRAAMVARLLAKDNLPISTDSPSRGC